MGAKKKVDVVPIPPPSAPQTDKTSNTIITIKTSDNAQFKISQQYFIKYSSKLKQMIQTCKQDTIILNQADRQTFQLIVQYINLHKQKQPMKIITPIKTNQHLRLIMQQQDAEYINKIINKGDNITFRMMELAQYLNMEHLRQRLACGVALKLMKCTLDQLKEEYQLPKQNYNQDQLKNQMRSLIETVKYMVDQQ